ncbi:hypothetical protein [Streptomyces buecherae]
MAFFLASLLTLVRSIYEITIRRRLRRGGVYTEVAEGTRPGQIRVMVEV